MADNKIIFKVVVDDGGVITQLRATQKGYQDIDLTTKNAKNSAESLNNAVGRITKGGNLKNIKLTENEYKKLANTQNQLKNATGGASSAAMELGRVISDAPYGIRGMANNITQLVSQIGYQAAATNTATGATYGYVGALKAMWTALMGPLGIVLAITTAVSALDLIYGANEKAEQSTSDLKSEFESFADVLRNDVNVSVEEYIKLIKEKKRVDDIVNNASERYLEIEEEIANAKKNRAILENFQAKQVALHGKESEETAKDIIKLTRRENELLLERKRLFKETGEAINNLKDANEEYKKSNKKEEPEEEIELIKGSVAWYRKLISTRKKDRDDFATTPQEYQKATKEIEKFQNELNDLIGKKKDPKDKANILKELYDVDISDEARKKFLNKLSEMFDFSDGDFDLTIAPKLNMELSDETQAGIDAYNKEVIRLMSQKFKAEDFAGYADTAKEALSNISGFIDAQFDRQLVKENNRTNAMNEELNNRLLNENISAKERASIQNEIARNDEKLRVKQNEIKKKAFNTNKAFQLSMAVADTAGAVLKAYSSQLIPGDPTSVVRAQIAASIAGAMGALQIATIASSKFQPDAASTPIRTASGGGGGGGVGNRTFDFNLVGNNQQNQLAEAIGGQFDRPLKAYVVSKDISNQQQLDANIKSSARFGG